MGGKAMRKRTIKDHPGIDPQRRSLIQREVMMESCRATPHKQLIEELMDSRLPHSEREWAARTEIQELREALVELVVCGGTG